MTQFVIHPSIWQYDTCQAFAQDFHLGPQDLLLTNEFLYTPYFAPLNLPCPVLFQEKYGLGEPSDEMVEAIYRDMPKEVTRVIAVGGGGVLDIAKLLVLQHVTPILDLYDGKLPLQKARDLVLVPTTCGTGSEVTNISILALLSRRTKKGLAHESMFADQAVLIPELLKGLPFSVFATSSIDALIHAIESSLSPKASATTKLFGYQAIAWILKGYLAIRDQGPDARFPLLSQFLLASNYAGIAFGNAGCAAVHALSYPLGRRLSRPPWGVQLRHVHRRHEAILSHSVRRRHRRAQCLPGPASGLPARGRVRGPGGPALLPAAQESPPRIRHAGA